MYNYMHGQGIGVRQAALYIAWSEELEKHGDSKKADSVYQEGFKCGAEPADKLHQYHKYTCDLRSLKSIVSEILWFAQRLTLTHMHTERSRHVCHGR